MPAIGAEITDYIQAQIAGLDDELFELQHSIWKNPELAYTEKFAHDTLTGFMEKQEGWEVTKHAYGLGTAFLAVFKHQPEKNAAIISYNSEFDALPNVGHACGHNLIAVCGVTAAISTAKAMVNFGIPGTVKLIGTPAEEGGGGKIKLIEAGAYKEVDVSLMAHPGNTPLRAYGITSANQRFKLEYFGREAHAAASPWQGINALDAMVVLYNAVSVLRQQLLPTDIVQCHISDGGQAPNIITGHSAATFAVRAPTLVRLRELQAKVENCVKAGALATGCKYKMTYLTNYWNIVCNDVLASSYKEYMESVFGERLMSSEEDKRTGYISASSDQGNVSWVVPSLQPMFHVECAEGGPHTKVFTQAVKTKEAHKSAVETGMGLSFMGLELLKCPEKLEEVKTAWKKDIASMTGDIDSIKPVENLSELVYTE